MCVFIKKGKECVLMSRETWPFYLMCRDPRPETRGTPAGAGELLRGWQHLRRHRGPRGQLQAQHARPQRRLRYKSVSILLYVGQFSHFIFFVYLYFKHKDPQKAEIFYNQDKETPIYVHIYIFNYVEPSGYWWSVWIFLVWCGLFQLPGPSIGYRYVWISIPH